MGRDVSVARARRGHRSQRRRYEHSGRPGLGAGLEAGHRGRRASHGRRRAGGRRRDRRRPQSLRAAAGRARKLNVDDDRAVRATKAVAAHERHRAAHARQDPRRRLRGVRDQGRQARPDRARDHPPGRSGRHPARAAARDRREVPRAPHAGLRDRHPQPAHARRRMIASARMYSWSPSLAAAWHRLLGWVAAKAAVPMTVMDASDPTSLDELWARPDTFGGRIAYSTEHSHSGYNAPRFHLLRYRTPERATFYREVIGPFVRQRPCLDAVVEGRAEVAAIDGYGLDLLARHAPDVAARVRVVETTLPAPSPPLVASPGVDAATCERLTAALVHVHEAPEIRTTLEDLLLSRFVRVAPEDFQVFLGRQQAAEAAGYPKLA